MKRVICATILLSVFLCGCCCLSKATTSSNQIYPDDITLTPPITDIFEDTEPVLTENTETPSTEPMETQVQVTEPIPTTPTEPTPTEPKPTEPKPTEPTPTEPKPTEPTPTEPTPTEPVEHSSLYIPGVSVEDVIRYFNEVSLDAEYVTSGDPSKLQKWRNTITYIIYGEPTEKDLSTIASFTSWLNGVSGFPGIRETTVPAEANLKIYFCTYEEMLNILGNNFYGNDGGVTFWYNGSNQIYDATICYRTDLSQNVRNSVILEEIYNGLGPVQDTNLRSDSIIYSGYSTPQSLTAIDKLILRLLYHPQIKCGMNASECEAVIRQLYY